MKLLKTLLAGIVLVIAMFSAQNASAQSDKPSLEFKQLVVKEMQKQLPMEAAEGMIWTKFTLNSTGSLMTWVFKIDPVAMGTTTAEAKEEFSEYSSKDIKNLLGEEVAEVQQMMDCDCQLVFTLPDGTEFKYFIKK